MSALKVSDLPRNERSSGVKVSAATEALPLKRNCDTATATPGSLITGGAVSIGLTCNRSRGAGLDGWAGRRSGSSV